MNRSLRPLDGRSDAPLKDIGVAPAATLRRRSRPSAWASIVAVVVPRLRRRPHRPNGVRLIVVIQAGIPCSRRPWLGDTWRTRSQAVNPSTALAFRSPIMLLRAAAVDKERTTSRACHDNVAIRNSFSDPAPRRILELGGEIAMLDELIKPIVTALAPQLLARPGIGVEIAGSCWSPPATTGSGCAPKPAG